MFQWILTSSTESPHPFLERHRVNVLDQGKRERERERERGISFASVFVYVILQKR